MHRFLIVLFALTTLNGFTAAKAPFFKQGMALNDDEIQKNTRYPSAYNAPACIQVDRPWDYNVNVAFIYWYATQDAMDVAYAPPFLGVEEIAFGPGIVDPTKGHVCYQDFDYSPGFKIGIGTDTNHDGWTFNGEYTWFHMQTSQTDVPSPKIPVIVGLPGIRGWILSNWSDPQVMLAKSLDSAWKLHVDMLDVVGGRPFYEGRTLTLSPTLGLRALWIRQNEKIVIFSNGDPMFPAEQTATSHSHSWALGPVAHINGHYLVWDGMRIDILAGASLLYTDYTTIYNHQTYGDANATSRVHDISALRPTFDTGIGIGYGEYFFNNKAFLDLSVRYDFNIFWSQNMMRNFASQLLGSDNDIGNLMLHGLTINLRSDF